MDLSIDIRNFERNLTCFISSARMLYTRKILLVGLRVLRALDTKVLWPLWPCSFGNVSGLRCVKHLFMHETSVKLGAKIEICSRDRDTFLCVLKLDREFQFLNVSNFQCVTNQVLVNVTQKESSRVNLPRAKDQAIKAT